MAEGHADGHWVDSWAAMPLPSEPETLPPAPFTRTDLAFAGSTLRQTIRASAGGRWVRLRLSNVFGGTPLAVAAAYVAMPAGGRAGASAIRPGSHRPVTFDGRTAVGIPAGAQFVSDPLDFPVAPLANLTVTLHLAGGQPPGDVTVHPGSRTTSHLVAGDRARDTELPGSVAVEHWYFLGGLEVWSGPETRAAVLLGDSLTDGRGSTTDGNDRWPDRLLERLSANATAVAVVNLAAGGNRVLHDGAGPNALSRLDRDVLARTGAAWLVVFEGVNDIGTAPATPAAQKQVADDLIGAYNQIVRRAHAGGVWVYGATITPFGGHAGYDDGAGVREAARQAVNHWIRTAGRFDAVVDFDLAVRDPAEPGRLRPGYDVGDHLHINPPGYAALAAAVPAALFDHRPPPAGSAFD